MTSWRKSSRSNSGGQCVEVRNDLVALRDSKDPQGNPLTASSVRVFLRDVRSGKFDR
jgi:hypothetical protein